MPFCTKCGKEIDAEAAFCPRCGASVAGATPTGPTSRLPVSGIDTVIKEPAAQEYWVERIVAFVIDAVIVYVILGALSVAYTLPFFFISGIGTMAAMIAGPARPK